MSLNVTLLSEKNGSTEEKYGVTNVRHAIKSGDKNLILANIQQGLDINYRHSIDGVTIFICACNTENIAIVRLLLQPPELLITFDSIKKGPRHAETNLTSLTNDVFLSACQGQNYIDTIDWLLNKSDAFKSKTNICADSNGVAWLMYVVSNQSYSGVKLLLENEADPHIKYHHDHDAIYCTEASYDDGTDYMGVRDLPEIVVSIIEILSKCRSF
ncbi:unnamed protein product [Rotaria socialis]|uniref:Ankyrin repeat protein n=1 Tax=Rotaria socialis TaxID=392032 RepID=A0A821V887_9BILA|nr:unnamed protein product [Rotaria socialis]